MAVSAAEDGGQDDPHAEIEYYTNTYYFYACYNTEYCKEATYIDFERLIDERMGHFLLLRQNDYINDKVKVMYIPGYGRGTIAVQYLRRGDVLAVEKAFLIGGTEQMLRQLAQYRENPLFYTHINLFSMLGSDGSPDRSKVSTGSLYLSQQLINDQEIGDLRGLFPNGSMFNHSCMNNVDIFFLDNVAVLQANRDVAKGEYLFINYLPAFTPTIAEYSQYLQEDYHFSCQCGQCAALYRDFSTVDEIILTLDSIFSVCLRKDDMGDVRVLLDHYEMELAKLCTACSTDGILQRYRMKHIILLDHFCIDYERLENHVATVVRAHYRADLARCHETYERNGGSAIYAIRDVLVCRAAAETTSLRDGLLGLARRMYRDSIGSFVKHYSLEEFFAEYFE